MKKSRTVNGWHSHSLKKTFLIMKIVVFLLLAAFLQTQANSAYAQRTKLSLNYNNTALEKVLDAIENQSEFFFLYNEKLIDAKRKVSINANNENVETILNQLFASTNVEYSIVDRKIVLAPDDINAAVQQQRGVSGKVTDRTGAPLPGVTVVIKGTTTGTVTDGNGNYTLGNVPQNATLVFSFVGMRMQEVIVGNQTVINASLQDETFGIEEVVAIGYGTVRRADITGSVGIATKEDLEQPSFNVLQSLRGKIAGVNIFTNSGAPTGENRVIIRGVGTINASASPLYIVDGVAMDNIQFLNPNDIVSLQVLKDASAAAIYGSRGSNGVILITTERGTTDGLNVGYNFDVSAGKIRKKMDILNAEEFMEMIKISFKNAPKFRTYAPGKEPVIDLTDTRLFDAQGNPLYDTDWQDESMRTAISHDHQLSLQYGSDKHSMGVFVNYSDRQGILLNTYMERLSIKFAFDSKLNDWLTVGGVMTTSNIKENRVNEDFGNAGGPNRGALKTIVAFAPIFPVKWPDGTWTNHTQQTKLPRLDGHANPVHQLLETDNLRDRSLLFGNAYTTIQLLPFLEFRSELGINNTDLEARNYAPSDMVNIGSPDGIGSIQNSKASYWQSENFFTLLKEFGQHRLNSVLGASWQKQKYFSSSLSARGFPNNFYRYNNIGSATNPQPPQSNYYDWAIQSYFTRINYTYRNTYSAILTGRMDGSSRFGEDNKYGFFPSAGVSWLVSNEDFMSRLSFIDKLRLRSSYGVTGNTEIGVYQSLATIGQTTTLIDGTRQASSFTQRLPNPNLKWERTKMWNIGTEIDIFNSFISLEADYYYKLTEDLLYARPVPRTTGFNTILDNIGSVSNKGFDVLLTTRNIRKSNLSWTTTLNFNHNKNRVESLGLNDEDIFPGPNFYGVSNTILRVGEPIGSFWGLERIGTWNTNEAAEAALVGRLPGMLKRSTQRTIIGKGYPDWTGSFINRLNYRNFDVTLDLQFVYGVEILQQFLHVHDERMGIEPMFRTAFYNRWTEDNQDTKWPQIRHLRLSGADSTPDTGWMSDGSYLRGNLFSLGYTFDRAIIGPLGISNLRLNLSLENAFVIHSKDFLGYDPESTTYLGSIHTQGIFNFNYPKPTTLTFGVNVQF